MNVTPFADMNLAQTASIYVLICLDILLSFSVVFSRQARR